MTRRAPVIELIEEAMADVLRSKTGLERLAIGDALYLSARELIESSVRSGHPDWDAPRVAREVSRRIAGDAD